MSRCSHVSVAKYLVCLFWPTLVRAPAKAVGTSSVRQVMSILKKCGIVSYHEKTCGIVSSMGKSCMIK